MPEPPLQAYLPTVREDARDTVRALAAAVDAAGADFDCEVTYRMLVYTLGVRWREWVVAIGVSKAAVNLRFLWGQGARRSGRDPACWFVHRCPG